MPAQFPTLLQVFAVLVCSGSVLLMAIVLLRWAASFEARLKRIDRLLDRCEGDTCRKRVS